MRTGVVLAGSSNGVAVLKVIGAGSFEHSFSLRQYCDNFIQCGSERLLVDLTECTYLDSTFLGTLAGPALKLRKTGGVLEVAGSSRRVLESIRTLGLDRLFACVENPTPCDAADLHPLESGVPQRETTGELLLQAHQTLLECDPRNAPKFQDLVSYLGAEVGRRDRPASG